MNLELVETDDLIEELMGRFDSAVFAGLKDRGPTTNECIRYRGQRITNIGLAYRLQFHINERIEESYEPTDGDEPHDITNDNE